MRLNSSGTGEAKPLAVTILLFAALGMAAAIGYVGGLTGAEISFSVIYLLPVALAIALASPLPGAATAAAGAAAR